MQNRPPIIQRADTRVDIYNAFRRIADGVQQTQQSFASILRGEAPDGSGAPLIDPTLWLYKPGLPGNQTAFGGTASAGTLTLSSTSNGTKGHIYFGSPTVAATIDEANKRLGVAIDPLFRIHTKHTAVETMARLEGPDFAVTNCVCNGTTTVTHASSGFANVTNGMVVTGTGVPDDTVVVTATSASSILLNNAVPTGTITMMFALRIDIGLITNGSGTDAFFKIPTALEMITGDLGASLRVTGQKDPTNERTFLECGLIGGSTFRMALTGWNGVNGTSLWSLFSYTSFNTWNGTTLQNGARVGVNVDPAEYASSSVANQPGGLIVKVVSGSTAPALLVESTGTNNIEVFSVRTASGGSSPTKTLGATIFSVSDNTRVAFMNAAGGGIYAVGTSGNSGTLAFSGVTTDQQYFAFAGPQAGWSDSVNTACFFLGNATATSTAGGVNKVAWFTGAGFAIMNRIGFSSAYTLITNAQAANADFLAPSAAPEVLRLVHGSTANAGSIVFRIDTKVALTAGTGKHLAVFASNGNELFSVGADGTTANATVRFGRTTDTGYNEISGGSAPVWRSSIQNTATSANTILFTLVTANWFSDVAPAEGMRFGDVRTGVRRGFICGQGGGSLDRFGISSGYTVFCPTNSTNVPNIVGTEIVRVVNDTVNGGDTRIPLRIDSLRAGQTGHLIDVVSAVSGNTPFFVNNLAQLVHSVPYTAQTANYTVLTTDIVVNCTANTFTVTLHTAVGYTGRRLTIKNSGTGTITVATTSSQTIDGSTTQTLSSGSSMDVISDGANWIIV
jgi:hypothetical protein